MMGKCDKCGWLGVVPEKKWATAGRALEFKCPICDKAIRGDTGAPRKKVDRRVCRVCKRRHSPFFPFPFEVTVDGVVRRFAHGKCCLSHGPRSGVSYVEGRPLWQYWIRKGFHPIFVGAGWCAWEENGEMKVEGEWKRVSKAAIKRLCRACLQAP